MVVNAFGGLHNHKYKKNSVVPQLYLVPIENI